MLEVWVNAPPIEDGANQAVLKAVASELDVPVYAVRLRTGARSRTKVVEVQKVAGARPATLLKSLRS